MHLEARNGCRLPNLVQIESRRWIRDGSKLGQDFKVDIHILLQHTLNTVAGPIQYKSANEAYNAFIRALRPS